MNSAAKLGIPVLLAGACVPAADAVVAWTTPAGSTTLYDYSGGETDNGLFGDPTIVGSDFHFAPDNFIASAPLPGLDSAQDTLTVFLTVRPGQTITGFRVTEFGTREGTSLINGTMFVTDLNGGIGVQNPPLIFTDGTTNPDGSINWTGEVELILAQPFVAGDEIQFQLTNNITALNGGWRQKEGVIIEILPTPGALIVSGLGLGILGARRRR